jgi:hypothetical protein
LGAGILEVRFYMGIIARIFFFLPSFVIIMLGRLWEGLSLLAVVILCFILALYTAKKKCPHCGRLYIDSFYSYCPYCGGSLKKEDENRES